METKAILVKTDGYSITHSFFSSFEKAKETMEKQYSEHLPEEWDEDYEDMSYCGDDEAVLYNNGEDVYLWQIIDLKYVP